MQEKKEIKWPNQPQVQLDQTQPDSETNTHTLKKTLACSCFNYSIYTPQNNIIYH